MLEVLVFAALLIAIAQIWSRMSAVEERLRLVEVNADLAATPIAEPRLPFLESWNPPREQGRPTVEFEPMQPPLAEVREPEPPKATSASPLPSEEEAADPEPEGGGFGFEELFGRRLPIWAGGVTLAVAGALVVRYSIETGLLSPLVRFLSGLLFGAGLIAAAEIALRFEDRVRDRRVRQALAGAGIASLDASILVALNMYGLISPMIALLGMAAVAALAMALSLRFGAPSALLGLIGGLAAPALVGAGEPNVPLLTMYLALIVGGLSMLSRVQGWAWLGIGALGGGLAWGAFLLFAGPLDTASTVSLGFYLILLGGAFPLLASTSGGDGRFVAMAESAAGTAQMAALVATGGFELLNWGLFGLISIATLWQSRREEGLRHLTAVGFGIALLLLGAWTDPQPAQFAIVLAATGLIYGGPALLDLWRSRGSLVEASQIAGFAVAAILLASMHFYRADGSVDLALAAVALASACLPAAAAFLGSRNPARTGDARFAILATTSALLVAIAAGFAAPAWLLPLLVAALAALLLLLSIRAEDERLEWSGWAFAAAALPLLGLASGFASEADRLFGLKGQVEVGVAFLRWSVLACIAALFAWHARVAEGRVAAQAAAALLAYGAVSQLAPLTVLPLAAATGLLALVAAGRNLPPRSLLPAMAMLLAVSAAWAGLPMLNWAGAVLPAIVGDPVLLGELPLVSDVLLRLLAPAAMIAAALWMGGAQLAADEHKVARTIPALLGAVAIHILFKQLFAIASEASFVHFGLAERTLWEALIATAGFGAWGLGSKRAALALWLAALAHFGLFSVLLHNPLWADQSVGTVPILNLLLPSYGLILGLLWAIGRVEPVLSARFGRPRAVLQVALILLLAFSLLRQTAVGSMLIAPGLSAAEDIARSILAVLLAIGFLLWGIRRQARDWRIASLVLMLGAVAKVFLLDASGLEGLMRIASFVALGLSLIGIGWLYSRSLGTTLPLSSLR